jgi:electron transport complex protein RnfC
MSDFEMPCIRCGDCAAVCPEQLQPQQLLCDIRADRLQDAAAHALFDCSECGRCDLACPSHISLVRRFVEAKYSINQNIVKAEQASAARDRYETRNARLLRESAERAAREAAMAQQATSTDAVAAAIERARARKQQSKDRP